MKVVIKIPENVKKGWPARSRLIFGLPINPARLYSLKRKYGSENVIPIDEGAAL